MTTKEKIIRDLKLSKERYAHTMGVAACAKMLAKRHFPSLSVENIEIAALLHDFTKEYSLEEQKKLCKKYNINIPSEEVKIPKLYHAKTAAAVAKNVYGVDEEIVSAIYYHTTGRANMTEAEMVLYFADYIEENRTEKACVEARDYYLNLLKTEKEPLAALKKAILFSLNMTINFLSQKEESICITTIEARNWLVEDIKERNKNQ